MQSPDITALDYHQLEQLQDQITAHVRELRERGIAQLRDRFISEAAALGLTAEEVVGARIKRRKKRRHHQNDNAALSEDPTVAQ